MKKLLLCLTAICFFSLASYSQFSEGVTGHVKIDDINGESNQVEHEDEIEIFGLSFMTSQMSRQATVGKGRTRTRATMSPITVNKFLDSASPYLLLASLQGKSFPDVVITLSKNSGPSRLDYLVITLENVTISGVDATYGGPDSTGLEQEKISFQFESIKMLYIEQNNDGSDGDEHEIEYDIAAGA